MTEHILTHSPESWGTTDTDTVGRHHSDQMDPQTSRTAQSLRAETGQHSWRMGPPRHASIHGRAA